MRSLSLILMLLLTVTQSFATTYYIDAKTGKDSNTGQSKKQAWASIVKVNKQTFKPGDKVLFKSNTVYNGVLEPKGSGVLNKPIIIDSFGEGNKPQINGNGWKPHALLLHNVEYWEVNNLSITNHGKKSKARRRGVIVSAINIGELHHIVLNKLTISQVNGSLVKKEGAGSGILIKNGGDKVPSRFIDLQLLNNHIHHTERNGINFNGNSSRNKWFPSLEVVIKGNLIEDVPGDGIVVIGTDGALIEGNLLRNFPDTLPQGDAAAGIWPWSADNTIVQYNEVSGHKAKWDGQGFDSDFNSIGTIIQHNYSHDNYGGFLLVCNKGATYQQERNIGTIKTIVRGNVSINDGIRPYPTHRGVFSPTFHLTGPIEDTHIYDNMIIIPKKAEGVDNTLVDIDNWGGPWPMNTLFENNEIYFEDQIQVKLKKIKDVIFKNNTFSSKVANLDPSKNTFKQTVSFDLQKLERLAQHKLSENKNYE